MPSPRASRRPRRALLAIALLGVLLPSCAASEAEGLPEAQSVVPPLGCPGSDIAAAGQFVDSVGVATHLSYTDTPYDDFALVRRSLRELGVHHYRDGWPAGDERINRRARQLASDGVKVTFVHDPRQGGTPEEQHALVRDNLLPALEAAESLNERDARPGDWAAETLEWTKRLAAAYRSDPLTRTIPLVAPSLSLLEDEGDHRALSELQGTVDHGNTHDYPGKDLIMTDRILDLVNRHTRLVAGDVPPIATETGYSDGGESAPYPVMPPDAIGLLTPRLLLEHFRGGIARTFLYELMDEHPTEEFEDSFGLVEHDGTPKPAFRSVQALLEVLSAGPQRCDQAPLELSVEAADEQLRSLLLRGGEGTYHLALWRQVPVWTPDRPLDDAPVTVRLEIDNPVREVRAHSPHRQSSTELTIADGVLEVPVSGAVTVLELGDVGPAPAPAPTDDAATDDAATDDAG